MYIGAMYIDTTETNVVYTMPSTTSNTPYRTTEIFISTNF